MKISLTSIPVNDPIEAFKFYTDVLGFVQRVYVPEPQGTGLLLEPNNHPIYKSFQQGIYELGLPLIVFGVEDVQKEYERLSSLGVVFREGPTKADWGTYATLDDTCGNNIQIHQAP